MVLNSDCTIMCPNAMPLTNKRSPTVIDTPTVCGDAWDVKALNSVAIALPEKSLHNQIPSSLRVLVEVVKKGGRSAPSAGVQVLHH